MDQCTRVAWFPGMEAIAKHSNFLFSPMSHRAGLARTASSWTARSISRRSSRPSPLPLIRPRHGPWTSRTGLRRRSPRRTISSIERATAGRLRNVLPGDAVGRTTKIILANGLHFKATWARRFDPSDTVRRDFLRHDGRPPVRVPFLSDAGRQYAESFDAPGLGFKVLQCFYKMVGRDGRLDFGAPCFSMLVFLPHRRDGLADLLRLAVTQPDFVMRCVPRREQLVCPCMVPKFRFSFKFDVRNALRQLGLTAPFNKDVADLSGMVSNMPPEGLYVSAVRQTSAVEVDEEGTTAVAAMYSASSPTYSAPEKPPPPPMSFVADHPFMFAIVEYEKAEVLFLGHVMDPSKED
ncbi:hypothetical protein C2845_PM16G14910 [Panicum miliaceum]|uniref:Serpin domain-containing protein n=1 Tax=Panicum miliaceum TaxID=4540 RepID=A0A3L6PX15_PANMI|nr:hypothetical protein C2845_PM16G14910 [Panicum miliaceum]